MNQEKPTPDVKNNLPSTAKKLDGKLKETEIGGFENRLEPTRYGDWEVNGRCSDF